MGRNAKELASICTKHMLILGFIEGTYFSINALPVTGQISVARSGRDGGGPKPGPQRKNGDSAMGFSQCKRDGLVIAERLFQYL